MKKKSDSSSLGAISRAYSGLTVAATAAPSPSSWVRLELNITLDVFYLSRGHHGIVFISKHIVRLVLCGFFTVDSFQREARLLFPTTFREQHVCKK